MHNQNNNTSDHKLNLPYFVASKEQVLNLVKEILQIEDFLSNVNQRNPGSKIKLPNTTKELDELATANSCNILNHNQRMDLAKFLRTVYLDGPEVGLYYSKSSDSNLSKGVIEWFRDNINPKTTFNVNENARIGAGIVIKIRHKTYDFSLKNRFVKYEDSLRNSLLFTPQQTERSFRRQYF